MAVTKLGKYIHLIDLRNKDLSVKYLKGISNEKYFIDSIANIVGTDLSNYKIVNKNNFAFGTVTSRNGDKISIALYKEDEPAIVSSSYIVFEVDENYLLPEYLELFFNRSEFDRYARYHSTGSTRETFSWNDMKNIEISLPTIDEQQKLLNEIKAFKKTKENLEVENINILSITNNLFNYYFSKSGLDECPLDEFYGLEIVTSGISKFDNEKIYLDTSCVDGVNIVDETYKITYGMRPSRANMNPKMNTVWFAKMSNADKCILINKKREEYLNKYIFSTGYFGLMVQEKYLYYIWGYINSEGFKQKKYATANGTMMESLNNSDLKKFYIKIPNDDELMEYNKKMGVLWNKEFMNTTIIKNIDTIIDLIVNNKRIL